jgi:hypothetical protein
MNAKPKESPLPLDQLHVDGERCPFCPGTLQRDGNMDGSRYDDQCSRPWYTCDTCGEGMDGDTWHDLNEDD